MTVPAILLAASALIALAGALNDILRRRIPNLLCFALAIVALAYAGVSSGWPVLASGLGHGLIALLVGMGLFRIGFVGGGDAKFYAAAAFAVPLGNALAMLGWTSLAGLFLVIFWMIARCFIAAAPEGNLKDRQSVPYGVAICCGYLLAVYGG